MNFPNLNNLRLVKLLFKIIFFVAVIFNVHAAEIDLTKKLPMDTKITYGKLDNGVTYYVKNNQLPKNKAYIELVIKAGSLHENDDQQGLAHLLEHMAFNSTKSFPKNKIDEYLRSLGLAIGADFNATTSFERTIYKFQIPTNDEKYLDAILQLNFPHEWKYVGDGNFWIEGRNPDFVNCNGKKIVIEYNGFLRYSEIDSAVNVFPIPGLPDNAKINPPLGPPVFFKET